ncbi:MAG TPA: ClbS/DfsB family four-helix bundle protein [Dehalococcoidia bacterium]|nr:ClbS/DfsB family four-helix bundle protein [Dehalococcoidia bacterium]
MRALTGRQQLVTEWQAAGEHIAAAIAGLTEEQASVAGIDGWSVKDHLNHMCLWHEFRANEIMRVSRGGVSAMPAVNDQQVEAINQTFADLRRHLPLAQVVADLEFARGFVLEAVQSCPENALDQSLYPEVSVNGGSHDIEHAEVIANWRKKEGI